MRGGRSMTPEPNIGPMMSPESVKVFSLFAIFNPYM